MPEDSKNPFQKNISPINLSESGGIMQTEKQPDIQTVNKSMAHTTPMVSPFEEPEKSQYTPNPHLKTLRTFQGDMEETIHKKNESVVSIAVAEQEKRQKRPDLDVPEKKINQLIMTQGVLPILGLILFIAGAGTLGIIYYYNSVSNAPVTVTLNSSLISYTDKKDISITSGSNASVVPSISDAQHTYSGPAGSVLYTNFLQDKNILPVADFFQSLAPSAPQSLARSLGTKYMSGIYSFDTNQAFIILSSADYGQSYSGMLKWETTMASDLVPLFPDVKNALNAGQTVFSDDTFNNQDVRVIKNQIGKVIFLYGFVNKDAIIITGNEDIFQSLVNKYINKKLVR
jgi:hypothetical protein